MCTRVESPFSFYFWSFSPERVTRNSLFFFFFFFYAGFIYFFFSPFLDLYGLSWGRCCCCCCCLRWWWCWRFCIAVVSLVVSGVFFVIFVIFGVAPGYGVALEAVVWRLGVARVCHVCWWRCLSLFGGVTSVVRGQSSGDP